MSDGKSHTPAGWSPSLAVAAWIVAITATVFLLRTASSLLIPIVFAMLISYALEPAVRWLEKWRVPRVLGAAVVLILILGGCGMGLYSLRNDAARAIDALPEAARRARQAIESIGGSAGSRMQQATDELQGSGTGSTQPAAQPSGTAASGWAQKAFGYLFSLAGHLTVVVFLVYFVLISAGHVKERLVEVAGSAADRRAVVRIVDDINARIQRFLLVTLFTATVVAVATWAVLAWMNIAQAAVWGILAGVFNSIPYFGPVIVSGGLFVVGLMQSGEPMTGFQLAGISLAITSLEGWLLVPPLMGKAERMHVLVVFVGLLFWTWVWGAWGTILAVPMLVVIKSVADHVASLKRLSRLMSP